MHPLLSLSLLLLVVLLSISLSEGRFDIPSFKANEAEKTESRPLKWTRLFASTRNSTEVLKDQAKNETYKLSYGNYDQTWWEFKREFGRQYDSYEEEKRRFSIFMSNVKLIEWHNWQYHTGSTTYWMKLNQFSDWTTEEFMALFHDMSTDLDTIWGVPGSEYNPPSNDMPDQIDWRSQGYVTPVKDQGKCGSCYAFSATGALEGQWFRKTRKLTPLSEQQIVDCSTLYGNSGCDGGLPSNSYTYIRYAGGIQSEATYRYQGKEGACKFQKNKAVATVLGYRSVIRNESTLKAAVGTVGPISVAIDATNNFMNYGGGVFVDNTCSQIQLNHAVLVVGYGKKNNQDAWIVKNSWNSKWGEKGYIFMARNRNNQCGIASQAVFPVV